MQISVYGCVGILVGAIGWSGASLASSEETLADYLNCVEVFTETDAELMRVTTLFCGEDDGLSEELDARQYVFAYVSKTSRAVDYQIQLMIRSEQPLEPQAIVADGETIPVAFRASTRACMDLRVCGYETAVSFSVKGLLIDGYLETLVADGQREWSYEVELSTGEILPFVFQADELRAVHYLTQGLLVAVPSMDDRLSRITGI